MPERVPPIPPQSPDIEASGDDPMTEKQAVILRDLCLRTNAEFDGALTFDQAEERIAELEREAGDT